MPWLSTCHHVVVNRRITSFIRRALNEDLRVTELPSITSLTTRAAAPLRSSVANHPAITSGAVSWPIPAKQLTLALVVGRRLRESSSSSSKSGSSATNCTATVSVPVVAVRVNPHCCSRSFSCCGSGTAASQDHFARGCVRTTQGHRCCRGCSCCDRQSSCVCARNVKWHNTTSCVKRSMVGELTRGRRDVLQSLHDHRHSLCQQNIANPYHHQHHPPHKQHEQHKQHMLLLCWLGCHAGAPTHAPPK